MLHTNTALQEWNYTNRKETKTLLAGTRFALLLLQLTTKGEREREKDREEKKKKNNNHIYDFELNVAEN